MKPPAMRRTLSLFDLEAIRHALSDPEQVAALLNLERSKTERRKWHCPRHGGSSLSLTVGADRTLRAKCFGCDFAGDVFYLIAEVEGASGFAQTVAIAAELAGVGPSVGPRAERRTPAPILVAAPVYPPAAELAALLNACTTQSTSSELVSPYLDEILMSYLQSRAIDAQTAVARGLVYQLPSSATVPAWATCGRPWSQSGHRLLCPLYDHHGELRSVRAWRPGETAPKRVAPKGFSTSGLVLADVWGQAMLRGEASPSKVIITEGEPDFFTIATGGMLLDERPAVLGVASGSWTSDIAARVPNGCEVRIATDNDEAGDRYAAEIATTLKHRCTVHRVRLRADLNDVAQGAA
jgi:Toprim-like/CHC2 zinc finger